MLNEPPVNAPRSDAPSWWSRNWLWAAPAIGLTPVLLCGGCLVALFWGLFGAVTDSAAYQDSLAAVRGHAAAREALGAPIEASFPSKSATRIVNARSSVTLAYAVSGPRGGGTVHVSGAAEGGGPWVYEEMALHLDGGPVVDLRPQPATEPAAEP